MAALLHTNIKHIFPTLLHDIFYCIMYALLFCKKKDYKENNLCLHGIAFSPFMYFYAFITLLILKITCKLENFIIYIFRSINVLLKERKIHVIVSIVKFRQTAFKTH